MYERLTSNGNNLLMVSSSISLRNKFRRLPMEKKTKLALLLSAIAVTIFYLVYCLPFVWPNSFHGGPTMEINVEKACPLTKPTETHRGLSYRIGIISDLDEKSKSTDKSNTWFSLMKRGELIVDKGIQSVTVVWDDSDIQFTSSLAQGGRGMELSELVCFDGRILSLDDRTGVIYQLIDRHVAPWVVMADGDGSEPKGFKGEWATVKDGELYVGGLGKEWTTSAGEILNFNPQYVKIVGPSGSIRHVNWVANYKAMLKTAGIKPPGYLIHESALWSPVNKKWFFLPRRASKLKYDDKKDEHRGTNMLITCSEDFGTCERTFIGPLNLTHGFSSFKFIPHSDEQTIVALKTEEVDGIINSYIMAFDISGKILMREQQIPGSYKFEGIEFL